MLTAADVMSHDPLIIVRPNDTLATAAAMFETHPIHHLPVVDDGRLVGLLTKRDVLRARLNGCVLTTPLRECMIRPVLTVMPETPLRETLDRLLERHFDCLPVVSEDGTLVGIVTSTDFARLSLRHIEDQDAQDLAREWEH